MPFRSLGSYEKKLLAQTIEGRRNGVIFSSKFSLYKNPEGLEDDNATLYTGQSDVEIPLKSVLCVALKKLIPQHVELYTTVNEKLYFTPTVSIRTTDVIKTMSCVNEKEILNGKGETPSYMLRHIFNKYEFKPNCGKPLWEFYIINDSILIFHGHDVLFDIFSAATFQKKLLHEMDQVLLNSLHERSNNILFKFDGKSSLTNFPRSIYENPKLHLPALTSDLLNLQTQSFFKTIYQNTLRKPIDLITSTNFNNNQLSEYKARYNDILTGTNSLCGTTVLGEISPERFQHLSTLVQQENITLKSFICAIVLVCLKPIVKNFEGSIIFSIPVNLRSMIVDASEFGLFYKNIRVECPLGLIDDDKLAKSSGLHNNEYTSSLEMQFESITNHVSNIITQRMTAWKKYGFNDDDIKRMKFSTEEKVSNSPTIQVNDVTEITFDPNNENSQYSFELSNLNFTRSLSCNEFMSMFYSPNEKGGLNICIHYPDGYNMEAFVECFQSFINS